MNLKEAIMQNIFDATLGTNFARAERNARSEDFARLADKYANAERIDDVAEAKYQEEMKGDVASEFMFGGYFNTASMSPEEHEMLNVALRSDKDSDAVLAFNIIRKYVRHHVRDVAEFRAN